MLIVPFIHKITKMDMHVHNIRLLTIGGTHLWNENTDEIEKLLMENGIYGTKKARKRHIFI